MAERRTKKKAKRTAKEKSAAMQKKLANLQKPFVPSAEQRQQVELMVGLGLTYEEIAVLTINPSTNKGISTATLQQHFADQLATGRAKVKSIVTQSLVKRAIDPSHANGAASAMFILKCQYGWKERHEVQLEIKSGVLIAPATLSPQQWIEAQSKADAEKEAGDE